MDTLILNSDEPVATLADQLGVTERAVAARRSRLINRRGAKRAKRPCPRCKTKFTPKSNKKFCTPQCAIESARSRRNALERARRKRQPFCPTCENGGVHQFKHGRYGAEFHGCECIVCQTALATHQARMRDKHADRLRKRTRERYNRDLEVSRARSRRYARNRVDMAERRQAHYAKNADVLRVAAVQRRLRRLESEVVTRSGPWTPGEMRFLIANYRKPVSVQAAILGRSYESVVNARAKVRKAFS